MDDRAYICAKDTDSLEELISVIERKLAEGLSDYELLLPYSEGGILNSLTQAGKISSSEYLPEGIKIIARLTPGDYNKYSKYAV